jgi:hypothetical protein
VFAIEKVVAKPLAEAQGACALGFNVDSNIAVGRNSELSIAVGSSVRIGVHESRQ